MGCGEVDLLAPVGGMGSYFVTKKIVSWRDT
jgi:hypothetical protein